MLNFTVQSSKIILYFWSKDCKTIPFGVEQNSPTQIKHDITDKIWRYKDHIDLLLIGETACLLARENLFVVNNRETFTGNENNIRILNVVQRSEFFKYRGQYSDSLISLIFRSYCSLSFWTGEESVEISIYSINQVPKIIIQYLSVRKIFLP